MPNLTRVILLVILLTVGHMEVARAISSTSFSPSSPPAPVNPLPIPADYETRICAKTVPLPRGITAGDASIDDWRTASKSYARLEAIFQLNSVDLSNSDQKARASRVFQISNGDKFIAKYLWQRAGGVPQESMKGFADVFTAKKLYEDGNDAAVLALVGEVRKSRTLKAKYAQLDEAELKTYIKAQNLDNALLMFEAMAAFRSASTPAQIIKASLEYLRIRNGIWSAMELFQKREFDAEVASALIDELSSVKPGDAALWPAGVSAAWALSGHKYFTLSIQSLQTTGRAARDTDFRVTVRIDGESEMSSGAIIDGKTAATSYKGYVSAALDKAKSDNLTPFDIRCDLGECELQIGQSTVLINKAELKTLREGRALPATHPLSHALAASASKPLLAFGNPFTLKGTTQRDSIDSALFWLQKCYPDILFVRDRMTADTIRKTGILGRREVPTPSDVISIVPPESFGVSDRNIVGNIRQALTEKGIVVEDVANTSEWSWRHGGGKAVLVITAHSSQELRRYVQYLGEKGVFRDNVVVLNSCGTPVTRDLAESINADFGAIATLTFQDKISAADVEDFLLAVANDLADGGELEFAKSVLRRAREQGLPGLWTVARREISSGAYCRIS